MKHSRHFKILLLAFALLLTEGFAQIPVIYSTVNISNLSPGVYSSYSCQIISSEFWADPGYVSYNWSNGQTTPRITVPFTGSQNADTLKLVVQNGIGQLDSSIVILYPAFNNSFGGDLTDVFGSSFVTGCSGDSVKLGMSYPNADSLIWSNGHIVTSSLDCDEYNTYGMNRCWEYFNATQSVSCVRVSSATGCRSESNANVVMSPLPPAPTLYQHEDTLIAFSPGISNYHWFTNPSMPWSPTQSTSRFYFPNGQVGNYWVASANGPSASACESPKTGPLYFYGPGCYAYYTSEPDTSGAFSILVHNLSRPVPGPGVNYTWAFGDGASSTLPYPSHQYSGPGTYQVCVTVDSGSCSQTFCEWITVTNKINVPFSINVVNPNATGIDTKAIPTVSIYPNPNEGQFVIAVDLDHDAELSFEVVDIKGTVISSKNLGQYPSGFHLVDWQDLPLSSGIYMGVLKAGTQSFCQRIVVE